MQLPEAFVQQMQEQLGQDWPAFYNALASPPPVSIRWNSLKNLLSQENYEGVKWNANGVYLPERPVFTLDPLLHAGAYYVQEASSMLLGEAIRQLIGTETPIRALDLCAAPGGKTSLLVDVLAPQSLILANEVIKSRYWILQENLIKWGSPNVYYSNHDSQQFEQLDNFFDLILVDAPCSGEGLFRKDPTAVSEWSSEHVKLCAGRQRRILANIYKALAPGGVLIYCTCTYNDTENTENAKWLEEECGLENLEIDLPEDWQIVEKPLGYQCYPHRSKGEGFYISCFSKQGTNELKPGTNSSFKSWKPLARKKSALVEPWLREDHQLSLFSDANDQVFGILQPHVEALQVLDTHLHRRQLGLLLGTFKRDQFIPSPELALSTIKNPALGSIELSKEQALRFLKKETFEIDELVEGWTLANYQSQSLGWMKGINRRFNNYYPKEWRIRMDIQ